MTPPGVTKRETERPRYRIVYADGYIGGVYSWRHVTKIWERVQRAAAEGVYGWHERPLRVEQVPS